MTEKRRRTSKQTKRNYKYTAATADKHELYQLSVQDPEVEIAFVHRVYKKTFGRAPLTLREDFCGTAFFCAEWVKSHADRTAIGIDLDQPTLDWGMRRNLAPLGAAADRVKLLRQNVLDPVKQTSDIALGLNFSYWVFMTRPEMRAYFEGVRASLSDEGLFVLDAYGGPYSMEAMTEDEIERTQIKGGFTYVWDQHAFNAIDHSVTNHIHFEFKDGTKWDKAFTYEWRYWTLPELRELLDEAGFSKVDVHWDVAPYRDEEDYRVVKRADNQAGWLAYLVAAK